MTNTPVYMPQQLLPLFQATSLIHSTWFHPNYFPSCPPNPDKDYLSSFISTFSNHENAQLFYLIDCIKYTVAFIKTNNMLSKLYSQGVKGKACVPKINYS